MKKKIIIASIILIIIIVPIIIININKKEESNSYTIETYIDGKLAASLPSSGSGYEFESISCDDNTVQASFNYSTLRVEVKNLSGKTKCTVKFKSSNKETLVNHLKSLDILINENGLRYEGADVDVHNYVLFNDELWRIIGIFNVYTESSGEQTQELVKLIRAEALNGLAWNSEKQIIWEGGSLQQILNNGYLNKENMECNINEYVAKICNFSETGINAGAREKIEAVKWNVGASTSYATVEEVYNNEILTQTSSYYKVGLMSASDYGYAVESSKCVRTTNLGYNTSTCAGSNWLLHIKDEWTITPDSSNTRSVLNVDYSYSVRKASANNGYGFRPSVYLKSTVLYISGDGTYDKPFIIS